MINRFFIYSILALTSITSVRASDDNEFSTNTYLGEPSNDFDLNDFALPTFTQTSQAQALLAHLPQRDGLSFLGEPSNGLNLNDLVLPTFTPTFEPQIVFDPPSPRDKYLDLKLDLLGLKPFPLDSSSSVCEICEQKCFSYKVQKSTGLRDQQLRKLLYLDQLDTNLTFGDNSPLEDTSSDIGPGTLFHKLVLNPNSLSKDGAALLFKNLSWITLPNSEKGVLGNDINDESNFCGFDILDKGVISHMSHFLDNRSFKSFSSTSRRINEACKSAIPVRLIQILDTIRNNYSCRSNKGLTGFFSLSESLLDMSDHQITYDLSFDHGFFKFPAYLDLETGSRPLYELTLMHFGNSNVNAPRYLDLALGNNAPTVTEKEHSVVDTLDLSLTDEGQIYSSDKSTELNKESLKALDLATD